MNCAKQAAVCVLCLVVVCCASSLCVWNLPHDMQEAVGKAWLCSNMRVLLQNHTRLLALLLRALLSNTNAYVGLHRRVHTSDGPTLLTWQSNDMWKWIHTCRQIYDCIICTFAHIYIERELERQRETYIYAFIANLFYVSGTVRINMCVCMYIYICAAVCIYI